MSSTPRRRGGSVDVGNPRRTPRGEEHQATVQTSSTAATSSRATHLASSQPREPNTRFSATSDSAAVSIDIAKSPSSCEVQRPMLHGVLPSSSYRACEDARRSPGGTMRRSTSARRRYQLEYNSFAASGADSSFFNSASSDGDERAQDDAREYTSFSGAAFHIFKGNVGAGVFLLPTYYQEAGYVVGAVGVVLLGLLMIDCALQLLRAKHTINRADVQTYPAVMEFVLGAWFKYFAQFALIFTQFGFCIVYVQYSAFVFAELFSTPHLYAVFVLGVVVLVTPMTFFSHQLSILAYASMVAGFFVSVVLLGTTAVDVQHLATRGVAHGVQAWVWSARLVVFLSGHMFSLEGIGVVLPVENSVAPENRPRFGKVVRHTLLLIVAIYILFGVLGYLAYGSALRTSVVVALPASFVKDGMICLLGLSLIFGYPIQYVPAIQLVDGALGITVRQNRTQAFLVRAALNALFGVIALGVGGETITTFASFIGAFAGVHLMITLPTLLALQLDNAVSTQRENLTYWQYMQQIFIAPLSWSRVYHFVILLFAMVVWIGGMYYTCISVMGS